jgi:Ca2+-transporting ATPase
MARVDEAQRSRLVSLAVSDARYLTAEETLVQLGSTGEGLDPAEASRRLAVHGPNLLEMRPPVPAWRVLLRQFRSVVVLLLVVAMAVAAVSGDLLEAAAIGAVLALNAAIGFVTEIRAHRAVEALARLGRGDATVIRRGEPQRIPASELVPGDVVALAEGETVPADGRVLDAAELRLNESALTGESIPVSKRLDPLPRLDAVEPVAERNNSVFKGTLVATGQGTIVVTATGDATEIGRISSLAQEEDEERTPLERQLDRLGGRLIWLTLAAAGTVMMIGWARGNDWITMLETGIALAIAAVPEGLPAVATITLALGMRRMAARNALVRRLPAVETLGSCTVVCTDKTGTLTQGSMTAVLYALPGGDVQVTGVGLGPEGGFESEGRPIDPRIRGDLDLALACGLLAGRTRVVQSEERDGEEASGEWVVEGDPTEGALVVSARKAGWERKVVEEEAPLREELPFSSERGFMAVTHVAPGGEVLVFAKGSAERILERCDRVVEVGGEPHAAAADRSIAGMVRSAGSRPLDEETRLAWLGRAESMGVEGLRVLALAVDLPEEPDPPLDDTLGGLCLLGLVGLQDPADEAVEPTIRALGLAGIRTVMITGDQHATALSVAGRVGLVEGWEDSMEGIELGSLADDELRGRVDTVGVYSRVDPEGKLRIVEALRSRGEIVGMLGDGVNDAAALRVADVGVAMGIRGTDVARETSDLVLMDDRFETVAAAVEEGRVIFDNIRKFIYYLFSCNLSEVLVLLTAGVAGWPLPLLPLQILWLNLLTDVLPALTLAGEPGEADVMKRPPRDPAEAIMSPGFLLSVGSGALLLTVSTLGVFLVGLGMDGGRPAVTMAFTTLALTQLAHAFNARSRDPVVFSGRFFSNPWVLGAVCLAACLQVGAVYLPWAQDVLHTVSLEPRQWAWVVAGSLIPLVVGQVGRRVVPADRISRPSPESPDR